MLPASTITLLLADVEGSTRLWQEREAEMPAELARLDEVLDNAIQRNRGVRPVEQGEGDSFVAAFDRPSDAAACALDIQRALAAGEVHLRIGLHSGDVTVREHGTSVRYMGPTLNRAARIRDAGHGGQVLLSRAACDLLVDGLPDGASVRDLGAHRLKDLGRPEQLYQLLHRDIVEAFPPLRSLDIQPNNLPIQLTTFVGREAELRSLDKLLVETRLLTLTGIGGCGKTRLGLELASRALDSMKYGAWLVDLGPVVDERAVPSAIANALGLRDDGRRPIDQIVDHLRERETLLLLDNCEHLISTTAEAVDTILSQCAAVSVVATSREPLGVAGETAWRVPSLSVPERRDLSPEAITEYEAVQLFVERARQARPNFSLTHEAAADVTEVCERLDGIPLAIELAAARVRMLSLAQIREGLANRFHLLTGGARTAVRRQQTLRASVDWSFDLLVPAERLLLARLSVFAGGFTLDAAEEVASGSGIEAVEILDLLTGLVDRSLVQADESPSVVRHHLLETIREYAAEQLVEGGEAESARDRHAAFFRDLAETAEPHLERHEQVVWADLLEQERANLRAAVHWAATRGDGETAQRIVAALTWFFVVRGHLREAKRLFNIALTTAADTPATHARALQARSYLEWHRLEIADAVATARQAAELARQVGDRRTEVRALYMSGFLTAANGEGLPDLEASIAIAREVGDVWCLAHALAGAGVVYDGRGDTERCQELLQESIAVCDAMGDTYIVNTSRFWLGRSLLITSERAAGAEMLEAVVTRARELGDTFSLPMALSYLALDYALNRDEERAFTYFDEAIAIARPIGLPRESQLAMAMWLKAIVLLGKQDRAVRPILEELSTLGVERGRTDWSAVALAGLALIDIVEGDRSLARARLAEAQAVLPVNATPHDGSFVNLVAAVIARRCGDLSTAEDLAHEALARDAGSREDPGFSWRIEILETLAGVLIESGEARGGVRLLAAADAGRVRHLRPRPPVPDKDVENDLVTARDLLGNEEADAAWAEGCAMTIKDAVAFARRGRGPRRRPTTGWQSLTPTETSVVQLVAEGLSNPQIAERLIMSRRTVSTHLTHVFAKLGVNSRAELAAEATRQAI